jgi:hypothetical protein
MAIYSLRNRTTITTTGAACLEIITTSTDRPRIMEIGIFLAAATASTYGLGRPAAKGVTPGTLTTVQAEDPGDPAGTVQFALSWGTAPTVPAAFFRAISLPGTIGTGVIWTFPRGLIIPISYSIVIWNLATNSAATDIYAVIDE